MRPRLGDETEALAMRKHPVQKHMAVIATWR
jgi:hypothetical protein